MNDQVYKTAQIIGEHWAAEVVRPESPGLWLKCQGTGCEWEDRFYTDHAMHLAKLIHGKQD